MQIRIFDDAYILKMRSSNSSKKFKVNPSYDYGYLSILTRFIFENIELYTIILGWLELSPITISAEYIQSIIAE